MAPYKVIGTIKSVKGHCHAGHKVGDQLELSGSITTNLCGWFYHDIFPKLILVEYGVGKLYGKKEAYTLRCPDRDNEVTIELQRIKKTRNSATSATKNTRGKI